MRRRHPIEPADEVAILAHDVGVKYSLGLTRDRTLRRAVASRLRHRWTRDDDFWALQHVSFVVKPGEVLGVIGRNGSGKSTLMLAIAGIIPPDRGTIRTFGRRSTLLTLGAGFEPELTGRQNIYLNAAYLGLSQRQIEGQVGEIVEFSELGDFIDVPLKKYSSGMRARLGFSIAAHADPEILLLDEVLSVGDAGFQAKSREKMVELIEQARAIVIVSHSIAFVTSTCTKALWLDGGVVRGFGETARVAHAYAKRYADTASNEAVRSLGEPA